MVNLNDLEPSTEYRAIVEAEFADKTCQQSEPAIARTLGFTLFCGLTTDFEFWLSSLGHFNFCALIWRLFSFYRFYSVRKLWQSDNHLQIKYCQILRRTILQVFWHISISASRIWHQAGTLRVPPFYLLLHSSHQLFSSCSVYCYTVSSSEIPKRLPEVCCRWKAFCLSNDLKKYSNHTSKILEVMFKLTGLLKLIRKFLTQVLNYQNNMFSSGKCKSCWCCSYRNLENPLLISL